MSKYARLQHGDYSAKVKENRHKIVGLKRYRVRRARMPDFIKMDAVRIMVDYPPGHEPRKGKHGRLRTQRIFID